MPNRSTIFDIEIHNAQSSSDEIKAVILDPSWQRQAGTNIYKLNPGQKIQDRYTLFPLGYLAPGIYSVSIRFVSINNPTIFTDHQLIITVVGYKNVLESNLETNPQGVDPRKDNLIKLNLRARYNIYLENLNVHIENSLFSKDLVTSVQGLESKTEEFVITLNPDTVEGDYDTKILIKSGENILVDKIQKLKVSAYLDIKETQTREIGFLSKDIIVTRRNDGNSLSNEVYSLTLSGFQRLFTKFDPEPTNVRSVTQGYKYEWLFTLPPGQSYTIKTTTNYRIPIFWLIIIVLVAYLSYKYLRKELFMHKKILVLKTKEGEIAGVKVLLRLKNNGPAIKGLRVMDLIPNSLEIPHEYLTLKPNSIKKESEGTVIIWEIPELVKNEERLISYKLKAKHGYKGSLVFRRSICRYKSSLGKISVAKSNEVSIFA